MGRKTVMESGKKGLTNQPRGTEEKAEQAAPWREHWKYPWEGYWARFLKSYDMVLTQKAMFLLSADTHWEDFLEAVDGVGNS